MSLDEAKWRHENPNYPLCHLQHFPLERRTCHELMPMLCVCDGVTDLTTMAEASLLVLMLIILLMIGNLCWQY